MAGFECSFVEKPPRAFQCECPICLLVLREPYQATCCGKSFCKDCVRETKAVSNTCPTCKKVNFVTYPNKGLQLSLYDFRVYCSHKSKGCEWTGELRELDNHLNSDPPADKSLEGCPFTVVECPLKFAGCEVNRIRKNVILHIQKDTAWHIQQQASEILRLETALDRVTEEKRKLEVVDFCVPNVARRLSKKQYYLSAPFYAPPRPCGYKMCIGVSMFGRGQGRGTHVSVNVHLMAGDFDDYLEWPFMGEVVVQILDRKGDEHCTKTIVFTEDTHPRFGERVLDGEMNDGWGCVKFLSHAELVPRYLVNDAILLQVSKVTLKEDIF